MLTTSSSFRPSPFEKSDSVDSVAASSASEQAGRTPQFGQQLLTGIDCMGRVFRAGDKVRLIDDTVVQVVDVLGYRFSYFDERVPYGLVSHPCIAVAKVIQ